jgi:hypothetical protein
LEDIAQRIKNVVLENSFNNVRVALNVLARMLSSVTIVVGEFLEAAVREP